MLKVVSNLGGGESDALQALSSLIMNQPDLFELGHEEQLLSELAAQGIVDFCITKPIFPLGKLTNLARDENFDEPQRSALQVSILILEKEHMRARHELESEEAEPDDEENDESDEDAESDKLKSLIKYVLERYTFKNEFIAVYERYLSENKNVERAADISKKTAESAAEKWEKTKENLRAFFALIGLDGVFVVIEVLMKRSRLFEIFMKAMGSLILPPLMIIYLIWVLAKWMASPLEKAGRWFAEQVNFKIPGGEDPGE